MLESKHIKKVYIQAGGAEPAPPLGTILGNLGVNTNTFCTSFNTYTQKLPSYFKLKAIIYIFDNRSTSFKVLLPSTGYILNLLKYEKQLEINNKTRNIKVTVYFIDLFEVIKIALFKFPYLHLRKSISIIAGSLKSMNVLINVK